VSEAGMLVFGRSATIKVVAVNILLFINFTPSVMKCKTFQNSWRIKFLKFDQIFKKIIKIYGTGQIYYKNIFN